MPKMTPDERRAKKNARMREYNRKKYWDNPEKAREHCRLRYAANPDRTKVINDRWRKKNPDKKREYWNRWCKKNPEKHKASEIAKRTKRKAKRAEETRRWIKAHPEKKLEYDHRRRSKKATTLSTLTARQAREILATGCFFSDNTCSGPLTIAHDIPVSKGGNTTRGNTFCLCKSHNSRMHTHTLADQIRQLTLF